MIDFIKWNIDSGLDRLLDNPALSFKIPVDAKTGEIKTGKDYQKQVAEWHSMEFIHIKNLNNASQYIEIVGSLHKLAQMGTNYNDFNLVDLKRTIEGFCSSFNLSPNEGTIHRIEYGLNITPSIPVKTILDSLVCFDSSPFQFKTFDGKGDFHISKASQYSVKVYDKGKQFSQPENILRFEIRADKMQYLHTKGIHVFTLQDAIQEQTLEKVGSLLTGVFNRVLFQDWRINPEQIKPNRDRITFEQGRNPLFWKRFKQDHSKKGYQNKRKRFVELVKKYEPNSIPDHLRELIRSKWEALNSTPILPSSKTQIVPRFYTHIVGKKGNIDSSIERRFCRSCGRDISHQKKGSQFCSEKDFGPEVKRCRNLISNRKQKELRLYPGPLLFDIGLS